jgi:DNA-directed RNA polymerase subunit RPC12/RpoP
MKTIEKSAGNNLSPDKHICKKWHFDGICVECGKKVPDGTIGSITIDELFELMKENVVGYVDEPKKLSGRRVKCLECGKVLESLSRHDFVECGCPNGTFVDGGGDYCRYGGVDMKKIELIEQ